MPLSRDKIIGFDQKTLVYRFLMLNGNRPVDCSVSNAVFQHLEKKRYATDNPDALFLRWRETIERAISAKFDSLETPDCVTIQLFVKDLQRT